MTDKDKPRADETDHRNAGREQSELDRARDWHREHRAEHHRKDLSQPGTRAWRTDHTEVMLVEAPGSEESEVYLRVTDITTGSYVQAPLTADDLDIVAHILQHHAARLRRLAERR